MLLIGGLEQQRLIPIPAWLVGEVRRVRTLVPIQRFGLMGSQRRGKPAAPLQDDGTDFFRIANRVRRIVLANYFNRRANFARHARRNQLPVAGIVPRERAHVNIKTQAASHMLAESRKYNEGVHAHCGIEVQKTESLGHAAAMIAINT
jgi:hypothetical protein